jgi:WXG100 family type VII secretion target
MAQIGAQMEQMVSLRSTFDRESAAVGELLSTLSNQIGATWWVGPAAERFRDQWNSQFAPTLRQLQSALQEASGEVQRRHDAILQAGS